MFGITAQIICAGIINDTKPNANGSHTENY